MSRNVSCVELFSFHGLLGGVDTTPFSTDGSQNCVNGKLLLLNSAMHRCLQYCAL